MRYRSIVSAVAVLPTLVATHAEAALYPYTVEHNLDATELYAFGVPLFADLDGDGDADVVLATETDVWWYENDGGLDGESQERSVDPAITVIDDVAVADLDQDGDLDVITSGDGMHWYENVEHAATFVAHTIADGTLDGQVDAGDVDGDGDIDVILAESYDDELLWYVNPGTPDGWAAPTQIPTMEAGNGALVVFDADDDGASDVLLAGPDGGALRLLRYDAGPWVETQLDPGSGVIDLRAADLDDDGDLDVLCGQARHAVIFRNLGDGLFGVEELDDNGNIIIDFQLDHGDVDGDGDEDVISVTHGSGQAIRWYANEGGTYGAGQTILDEFYNSGGMDVGDIDCDGDADVVAHGDNGFWHVMVLNNETVAAGVCEEPGGEDTGGDETGTGETGGSETGVDDSESGSAPTSTTSGGDDGTPMDGGTGSGGPMQGDDDGGGGGCSVVPNAGAPIGTLALFVLAAARRRRRR